MFNFSPHGLPETIVHVRLELCAAWGVAYAKFAPKFNTYPALFLDALDPQADDGARHSLMVATPPCSLDPRIAQSSGARIARRRATAGIHWLVCGVEHRAACPRWPGPITTSVCCVRHTLSHIHRNTRTHAPRTTYKRKGRGGRTPCPFAPVCHIMYVSWVNVCSSGACVRHAAWPPGANTCKEENWHA